MHCMRENKNKIFLWFIAGIVIAAAQPLAALLLSGVVELVAGSVSRELLVAVVMFLLVKLLATLGEAFLNYLQKMVQTSCLGNVRNQLYHQWTRIELKEVLEQSDGKIMDYFKVMESYGSDFLLPAYWAITKGIGFLIACLLLFLQNRILLICVLLCILLWFGITKAVNRLVERLSRERRGAESALYENITYLFEHLETVVSSGKEDFALEKYEVKFKRKRKAALALERLLALKEELLDKAFVESFRIALILLAVFYSENAFLADAFLYYYLAENIFASAVELGKIWKLRIELKTKREYLNEFFRLPVKERKNGRFDSGRENVISMEHVSLSFGKQQVLKDISLKIPKGKITVVIGKSGEGKTSLLRLMQGVYRPDRGYVRNGEQDYAAMDVEEILSHMGCFIQNGKLFSMSLLENIMLGRELGKREEALLAYLGIDKLLARQEQEKDSAEKSTLLSGGETQRCRIARTVLHAGEVLLFDEPTSQLDAENEGKVIRLLCNLRDRGYTIVIITHRMKLVEVGDCIVHIENGRVALR